MSARILTLFLSAGKSLKWWHEEGLLSREILVYREFLRIHAFDRIQIFTYDTADRDILCRLSAEDPIYCRIDLLATGRGKGGIFFALCGVILHYRLLRRSTVLKTNQISGSWAAILAALTTGRPLVLRMGYILSRRFSMNGQTGRALVAQAIERLGMAVAARVVVTSSAAHKELATRVSHGKLALLPTYVDVNIFQAKTEYDFDAPAITVGRMRPQKNQAALIEACAQTGIDLVIVGRGELENDLRASAVSWGVNVEFAGTVDNVALARRLQTHTLFVLPSLHEGLPKVLIEAMASGLVCIGTPIPGITDLIEDGVTGYLADGIDAEAIARAIGRAKRERDPSIGRRARRRVIEAFGLENYARREQALFGQLN